RRQASPTARWIPQATWGVPPRRIRSGDSGPRLHERERMAHRPAVEPADIFGIEANLACHVSSIVDPDDRALGAPAMRLPRITTRRWMIAVGCLLIAVGLLFGFRTGYARPGNPWAGVAEPITITGCFFFDDGGSRTLEFKDANQRKHYACWVADEH